MVWQGPDFEGQMHSGRDGLQLVRRSRGSLAFPAMVNVENGLSLDHGKPQYRRHKYIERTSRLRDTH